MLLALEPSFRFWAKRSGNAQLFSFFFCICFYVVLHRSMEHISRSFSLSLSLSLLPPSLTFIFWAQNLPEVHRTWGKRLDKRENLSAYILSPSQSILFGRRSLYPTLKNEKKKQEKEGGRPASWVYVYTLKNYSADGISKHSRLSGLAKLLMHLLLLASGDWNG